MIFRITLGTLLFSLLSCLHVGAAESPYLTSNDYKLADGKTFPFWEDEPIYTHTYFVDCRAENACDDNPGTAEAPFKTIGAASKILKPGEKVLIKEGVYREKVTPGRGGESPCKMITYQAMPGEKVVISGTEILTSEMFKPSKGWIFKKSKDGSPPNVWMIDLPGEWFGGYNPFGMANILHDLTWLDYKRAKMTSHFKRRGQVFCDGVLVQQVKTPNELTATEGAAYWIEHNGLRLHIKIPEGSKPEDFFWEASTKEQVFAPDEYGLGFIKLSGITFSGAANGFPVPQRGMVSSSRGHHWIIEDCVIENANSIGMDLGNECWGASYPETLANHIVRRNIFRNCGISGLQCYLAKNMLVEDNLFENIGWQDAEHAFESAGVKFHHAENNLIRRNRFSNITFAPGLWLDNMSNKNCRITANLFTDITTARGAIYIEVSRDDCLVDGNLIIGTKCQYWLSGEYGAGGSGLYTDGSDNIRFTDNLVIDAENTGYGSYLNAPRIIEKRGGITVNHQLARNIFINCGKHAIEFPHQRNASDFNIFSGCNPGYIKIANQELLLDKEAASLLYGWDGGSAETDIEVVFDRDNNRINIKLSEALPFKAGPFKIKPGENCYNIDPRKLNL